MACLYDRYETGVLAQKIIEEKGYNIIYSDDFEFYLAKNEKGWIFRAESLSALLGLLTVHESHPQIASDERLNISSFSDVISHVKTEKPEYEPVYLRDKND